MLLILLLWNLAAADTAEVCADLLGGSAYQMVLKQAREINPAVFDATLPLEEMYLRLKDEEYTKPDSAVLRQQLVLTKSKHFATDQLDDEQSLQFYRNSVRALYLRVYGLWLIHEARQSVGPVMRPELESAVGHLIAQYIRPWRLTDRDLTPQAAREHFRARPWLMLPWTKIASFLGEWFDAHPGDFEGKAFSRFWDQRAAHYGLSFELYQRLASALSAPRAAICCLSEPGCVTCPHNRRWRK